MRPPISTSIRMILTGEIEEDMDDSGKDKGARDPNF
jgi:hypothetical protein